MKKLFSLRLHAERAVCAFHCLAPALDCSVASLLPARQKSASSSGVPMPSCSERATSAFLYDPAPAASLLPTRQKASSVRKNLSQQG
ncbi:hypothetical protein COJ48_08540 [Bacillus cereus]|nr:hypothetical protein COJ48_08540 [Bacillus cereus]PGP88527.1 hypothetical protein CN997_03075 [Bacillus cereus]